MSIKNVFKKNKNNQDNNNVDNFDVTGEQTGSWDNAGDDFDADISKISKSNSKGDTLSPSTSDYEEELLGFYKEEKIATLSASKIEDEKDESENVMGSLATTENELFMNTEMPEDLLKEMKKKQKKEEKKKFSISGLFAKKNNKTINTQDSDFERKSISDSSIDMDEKKVSRKTNTSSALSESAYELKQKKIPIIGSFSTSTQYKIASSILILSILGVISGLTLNRQNATLEVEASRLATELSGKYKEFGFAFGGAVIGRSGDLQKTLDSWEQIQKDFETLKGYNTKFSASGRQDIGQIESSLQSQKDLIAKNINTLKAQEDLLRNITQRVELIQNDVSKLNDQIDRLAVVYVQIGASRNELANIYFIKGSLQVISNNISNLLLAQSVSQDSIVALNKARQDVRVALYELYYGAPDKGISAISYDAPIGTYKKFAESWVKFADVVDLTSKRGNDIIAVRDLGPVMGTQLQKIDADMNSIFSFYNDNSFLTSTVGFSLIVGSILLLLLSLALALFIYNYERENRVLLEKLENSKNQSSILRLLNEMIPLQDGDLTHKTTVTEEITGAIADSINATVDSLSSLVKKIKDTSFSMREKTNQVNTISINLLKDSEKQSKSISETGQSVLEISNAIRDISDKTLKTSKTARESAEMSSKGAQQVFASIESMQIINHNMTETVHLMKKVGESSKQISEIVNLLSDITEETNILALNATVQAAKAGDSGKGFKIVADSIQELANKASDATRRVGALISAVQTDIQSVSQSVEKTTTEVEKGVNLSENAGQVLSVIKSVSEELSSVVEKISEDALKHATVSEQISANVQQILIVTKRTKDSTEKTANSISEIAEISNELGESVQSFKVE